MFYFFGKNSSRIFSKVLACFLYNLRYRANIFWMRWLLAFCPLHFQCHEIALRVILNVLLVSLPLGHLYPFHDNHFSLLILISLSALSSFVACNSIYFLFKFHFQHYHFYCFASFYHGRPINCLFWLCIFVKCHVVYPWETRKQHNCTLCCLCVNWMSCAVTHHQQSLKEMMWLVTDRDAHLVFNSDLWTEKLAVKFELDATTHSSYSLVTKIWTMLLGDWCYLAKLWQLRCVFIGTMQSKYHQYKERVRMSATTSIFIILED